MLIKEKIGELFLKKSDETDICKLSNISSSELVLNNFSNIEGVLNERIKTSSKKTAFKFNRDKTITLSRAYSDDYLLRIPVKVQVRKHKKKRINKKWIKRYGFKVIYIDITN